jgi:hypothetical protein
MRYAKLMKKAEIEDVLPEVLLSEEDLLHMKHLETCLPLSVLQAFRQKAIAEMIEEEKRERQKEMRKESVNWWNWYGSGSHIEVEDDISLDSILSDLNSHQRGGLSDPLSSMKITVNSSSIFVLSNNFHPIVESKMAIMISVQSSQEQWSVSSEVTDWKVTDKLHSIHVYPALIAVRSTNSHNSKKTTKPTLSMAVESNKGKIKIIATALPIEIFVNKHCIHAVVLAFAVPKNTFAKKLKRMLSINRVESEQLLQKAVLASSHLSSQVMKEVSSNDSIDVEINLELHAPKIIIPEDCSQDKGCLLLDCGFLSAHGILCPNGQSFQIGLKAINAGLPLSFHDFHSIADRSLYLIKVIISISYQFQLSSKLIAFMFCLFSLST